MALLMLGTSGCVDTHIGRSDTAGAYGAGEAVTVHPREIDEVLYNPGMGFADFHFDSGIPRLPRSIRTQPWPIFVGRGPSWNQPKVSTTLPSSTG